MNKVLKAISIFGSVSEVIIASAMVAELVAKLRGKSTKSTINMVVEDNSPQPDQPIAA